MLARPTWKFDFRPKNGAIKKKLIIIINRILPSITLYWVQCTHFSVDQTITRSNPFTNFLSNVTDKLILYFMEGPYLKNVLI